MRVLVTGGAGFIGSHLSDALLKRGDEVIAIDDLSTGSRQNIAHLAHDQRYRFIEGDIRDARMLEAAMRECDRVVHLAARIGLKVIVESPLETIRVNAGGTEVVLDVAARTETPVIVTSTSEVYGLATKIPSSEVDPIAFGSPTVGRWSYACTKAFDEFYALALQRERNLPATVVRLFNTVGPRQTGRYGMVIPRFVTQALAGEPLTVYGDGTQTRCFCSVINVCSAFLTILDNPEKFSGEVFNVGNPEEITINELAKRVIAKTNSKSTITYIPFSEAYPPGFEEIYRRVPDITKARSILDFDPTAKLDDILGAVIESVRGKELAV